MYINFFKLIKILKIFEGTYVLKSFGYLLKQACQKNSKIFCTPDDIALHWRRYPNRRYLLINN